MAERVLKCPHCGAPLPPTKFRTATCSYCGTAVQVDPSVVFASKFRQAFAEWNQGGAHAEGPRFLLEGAPWRLGPLLAHGEVSDVFVAQRDRNLSERVLLKVLRDPQDLPLMQAEHAALIALHRDRGALGSRIPRPLAFGQIAEGTHAGRHALVLRNQPGFRFTFEAVRRIYPHGIEPRSSIWVWRRILETLAALQRSGLAHGAVLPPHLLIEDHEHGVLLVGFSNAGPAQGSPLRAIPTRWEAFYPHDLLDSTLLVAAHDVIMSARCVAHLLGGEPDGTKLPPSVPSQLAQTVREVAEGKRTFEAWALREQLGALGTELFGPPAYAPVVLPD